MCLLDLLCPCPCNWALVLYSRKWKHSANCCFAKQNKTKLVFCCFKLIEKHKISKPQNSKQTFKVKLKPRTVCFYHSTNYEHQGRTSSASCWAACSAGCCRCRPERSTRARPAAPPWQRSASPSSSRWC